jgi:hypothetical protein
MLYRSTDRLCRCGAPLQYLSHSASFHSLEKYAPPNAGTKHLIDTLDLPWGLAAFEREQVTKFLRQNAGIDLTELGDQPSKMSGCMNLTASRGHTSRRA